MNMTMSIKHHLTENLLTAYSAGALPEAFSLMVATHVSLCDDCRAVVESRDALGGALLERFEESDAGMSGDSLAATFAKISARATAPLPPVPSRDRVLPVPLRDYVGGGLDSVRWRSIGMGVKQAILPTERGASARLLFIPAGAAMPDHGHTGTEMTMVLKGSFSDELDRFARGDVEIADQDVHHTPIADVGEDCICLAVADGKLRFKGLLPRLAQPFLRI